MSAIAVIPVITIDGPTASGKGTVASRVAEHLGFALLDSGALYRLTALSALDARLDLAGEAALAALAAGLDVQFEGEPPRRSPRCPPSVRHW
jgi:cytidylate kinase